eukprot:s753_g6.t6
MPFLSTAFVSYSWVFLPPIVHSAVDLAELSALVAADAAKALAALRHGPEEPGRSLRVLDCEGPRFDPRWALLRDLARHELPRQSLRSLRRLRGWTDEGARDDAGIPPLSLQLRALATLMHDHCLGVAFQRVVEWDCLYFELGNRSADERAGQSCDGRAYEHFRWWIDPTFPAHGDTESSLAEGTGEEFCHLGCASALVLTSLANMLEDGVSERNARAVMEQLELAEALLGRGGDLDYASSSKWGGELTSLAAVLIDFMASLGQSSNEVTGKTALDLARSLQPCDPIMHQGCWPLEAFRSRETGAPPIGSELHPSVLLLPSLCSGPLAMRTEPRRRGPCQLAVASALLPGLVFVACHPWLEASRHCRGRGHVTRSVTVDTGFEGAAVEVMQIADIDRSALLRRPPPWTVVLLPCQRVDRGRTLSLPARCFWCQSVEKLQGLRGLRIIHRRSLVPMPWNPLRFRSSKASVAFESGGCFFASFEPYGLDQLESLLKEAADAGAERRTMGRTTDGRSIDALCFPPGLLQTGREPEGEPALVWITCRQHAAETQASFFAEGVVRSVLSEPLPLSLAIVLVPNMNPDGSVRGHTRENAQGVDLNREWRPKADYSQNGRSPEVSAVQAAMLDTGVDVHLDVHGDEAADTAYSYPGLPRFRAPAHVAKLFDKLEADALAHALELRSRSGGFYVPRPGSGSARTAAFWTGTQFGALSLTLEMPYKDSEQRKASSESCRRLGCVAVDTIRSLRPRLARFRLSRKRP